MKLNLSKPSCKWTKIGGVEFLVQSIDDDVKGRLKRKHGIDDVRVGSDFQIDEKSIRGKEDRLQRYFADLLDYCLLDWRDVSLDGENIAACNKANRAKLFKNHYGIAMTIIAYASVWTNFTGDLGETLKNSERPSHTGSNGNGVRDSIPVATGA